MIYILIFFISGEITWQVCCRFLNKKKRAERKREKKSRRWKQRADPINQYTRHQKSN